MGSFWRQRILFGVLGLVLPGGLCGQGVQALEVDSTLSLRSDTFVSPSYNATNSHSFGFLGASLSNVRPELQDATFHINSSGLFSPETSALSSLNVKEIYIQGYGFSLGRKLNTWSRLDEMWNLGFYQPQYRWNPLTPESQGLTGLFYNWETKTTSQILGVRLFASGLYLPDQSSGYQIQNGQFQSSNPWFAQLPSTLQFGTNPGVINQISWNIHMPDTNQVLLNSSGLAQFYFSPLDEQDRGLSGLLTAGFLPSNQLDLAAQTASTAGGTTNFDIYPELFNHQMSSADLRYNSDRWFTGFGALQEHANNPTALVSAPTQVTLRTFGNRQLLSPYIGARIQKWTGQVSYLDVQAQGDSSTGSQVEYLSSYLGSRLAYGSAVKAELSYGGGMRIKQWEAKTSYLQGTTEDFSMWNTTALYRLSTHWIFSGQLLLVAANPDTRLGTVFSQFQNNDAFTIGGTYVF